uniref:Uncharacterized protein n=1 Tax=Mola mola TaxID=94237 RepID=A0A3Q3W266_MOLML
MERDIECVGSSFGSGPVQRIIGLYVSMCECERELRGPIQRAAQVNVPFITAGVKLLGKKREKGL